MGITWETWGSWWSWETAAVVHDAINLAGCEGDVPTSTTLRSILRTSQLQHFSHCSTADTTTPARIRGQIQQQANHILFICLE